MPVYKLPNTAEKWLVVNADDFGLHPDLNRAIAQAHREGIVTSASLVACGVAFEQAVDIAQRCPGLDLGVHLTLVEERPLSPAIQIPSLVGPDGTFWPNYRALTLRLVAGRIRLDEVRRELRAQIQAVFETGLKPSHLDSHQHVHLLPGIWSIAVDLAREFGLEWLRVPAFSNLTAHTFSPVEPLFRLGMNGLSQLRRRQLGDCYCTQHTPGLYLSGRLTTTNLQPVLEDLPGGLSELVTHPGFTTPPLQARYRWDYHWQAEFEALIDPKVRRVIETANIRLVRFSDLTPTPQPPAPAQSTNPR